MEVIFERCGGIDVHKKDVNICIITIGKNWVVKKETQTYSTMTEDIERAKEC